MAPTDRTEAFDRDLLDFDRFAFPIPVPPDLEFADVAGHPGVGALLLQLVRPTPGPSDLQ